jgi:hypothetical protein
MTTPLPAGKGGYFASSRAPRYSILFALPLLLLYEGLAALLETPQGGMRNGADALLRGLFSAVLGIHGPAMLMTIVVLAGAGLIAMDMRRARENLRPVYFPLMLAESSVLAILFGLVIGTVTARLLGAVNLLAAGAPTDLAQMSWTTRLMLSLGAGLYEELFFRVLVVSGLVALGVKVFGWTRRSAVLMAVLVSAFVFSAFHYIPPYGDKLELTSFTFRFFSGVAFSALYVVRGFGITAWTHALYDAFLLLL